MGKYKIKASIEEKKVSLLLQLGYLILLLILFANKINLNIDEVLTYGLANYAWEGVGDVFIDEYKYTPAEKAYLQYVTVDEENRFNYKNVWNNQKNDVHPPLYYALVHTVCSLFPETFSLWFVGGVSIFFTFLTFVIIQKILSEFIENKRVVYALSFTYFFCTGIWDATVFLRMYAMMMFFVTLITYWVLGYIRKEVVFNIKYICLIAISIGGALTHYYFIIYMFFLYATWCIFLFIKKRYKEICYIVVNAIFSGGGTILLFPPILKHLFWDKGNRGEQSFKNFLSGTVTDYVKRFSSFFDFLNQKMFGGFLVFILVILVIFTVYHVLRKKNDANLNVQEWLPKWLIVMLPSLLYFLLVVKIAVYQLDRYMLPVYPLLWIGIFVLLYKIFIIVKCKKYSSIIAKTLIIILCLSSLGLYEGNYLYKSKEAFFEKTKEYSGAECVYIYDLKWHVYASLGEVSNYKSVQFVSKDNVTSIQLPEGNDEKVIFCISITCDEEEIIKTIQQIYPQLTSFEKIGGYMYARTYVAS